MRSSRSQRLTLVAALASLAMLAAACSAFTPQVPQPTPTDFAGIVEELGLAGIGVKNVISGDPGCDDQRLARTAISFDASGLDQAQPTRVHLYAFKNAKAHDDLRPAVDLCARAYVADPAAYVTVDASPYLLAGAGPWAPGFAGALRDALGRVAGGG